ncbi:MBL fold metallo-hydrolase [Pontibacter beigongshangensis]|uniref:MBL fold metallo-hydrolase n=1 Tax=Pontibacter beigongshangensis TaxID=2574733 RepID=UPI00164F95DA|nr:MBL fold metallo-hydrolase [Pontibacter beigongshangensis]
MQQLNKKIRHIRNEKLNTIKPDYRGNKTIDGLFANGDELYMPAFSKVLKWKLSPNPQRDEKQADTFVPEVHQGAAFIDTTADMVVWLGHSSFLIRLNGVTFLVDPVLYDLPLMKRRVALPCLPEQLRGIDFLLLSHGHRDHMDKKSIRTIFNQNPTIKALTPLCSGDVLRSMERRLPYQEAGWYQQYDLLPEGIEVYFMPASHWHRRSALDMNKMLWGSFVIKTASTLLYFAGDTGFSSHFEEIQELFGPMDICLMPVGAYKPSFLMQKSHLNPHEAVKAFNHLRGGTFIPMHYGTFNISDEPPGEPVRLLEQIAAAGMLQGLQIPAIGQPVLLRELVN